MASTSSTQSLVASVRTNRDLIDDVERAIDKGDSPNTVLSALPKANQKLLLADLEVDIARPLDGTIKESCKRLRRAALLEELSSLDAAAKSSPATQANSLNSRLTTERVVQVSVQNTVQGSVQGSLQDAAQFPRRITVQLNLILEQSADWRKRKDPLLCAEQILAELYHVQTYLPPKLRQACFDRINEIGTQIYAFEPKGIRQFDRQRADQALRFARDAAPQSAQSGRINLTSAVAPLLTVDFANSIVTTNHDVMIYTHTDKLGQKTEWIVECVEMQDTLSYTVRNKRDSTVVVTTTVPLLQKSDFGSGVLSQIVEQALQEETLRRSATAQEKIRQFDVPHLGAASFLSFLPMTYDVVMQRNILHEMLLGKSLRERYGARLTVAPTIFSDDPLPVLQRRCCKDYASGTRCFILDLQNHGSERLLAFKNPINGKDLVDLSNELPQAKLIVMTGACYNGGLIESVQFYSKKDPTLKGRICVLADTTGTSLNWQSNVGDRQSTFGAFPASTLVRNELVRQLDNPDVKTLGEAWDAADKINSRFASANATALIDGEYFP